MKMSQRVILLVMCLAGWPVTTMAADSTLVLVMGGEAYDGPPKFDVAFNGESLGEGTVAAAIDTGTAGRFADAADKTPYVQSFTFTIPEASFRPDGQVVVKFLNEAYGGEGSEHDRNLFLASVSLNGRTVTSSGLSSWSGRQNVASEMLGEFLVIPDGNTHAISEAPQGGWPRPASDMAVSAGPVVPSSSEVKAAKQAATVVVEVKAAPVEPVETAALDPDP